MLIKQSTNMCYFSVCGDFKDLMQFKTRTKCQLKSKDIPADLPNLRFVQRSSSCMNDF